MAVCFVLLPLWLIPLISFLPALCLVSALLFFCCLASSLFFPLCYSAIKAAFLTSVGPARALRFVDPRVSRCCHGLGVACVGVACMII